MNIFKTIRALICSIFIILVVVTFVQTLVPEHVSAQVCQGINYTVTPNTPEPNQGVCVSINRSSASSCNGNWDNVGILLDGVPQGILLGECDGTNLSQGYHSNINSGISGTHTLQFTIDNGSCLCNSIQFQTQACTPPSLTAQSSCSVNNESIFQWNWSDTGASSYEFQMDTCSDFISCAPPFPPPPNNQIIANSFTTTIVSEFNTIRYGRVRGWGCNNSDWSNVLGIAPLDCTIEATPTPTPLPPPPECAPGLNCCKCISEGGVCLELADFCDEGFEALCTITDDPAVCNQNTGCECVSAGTNDCGNLNQPCCQTGSRCDTQQGLYCDSSLICRKFQSPQLAGLFCDENGQPTEEPADTVGNPRPIYTAIGCIPVDDKQDLAEFMLTWSLGVGGGLSFLVLVYGGFTYLSSQGDPHKTARGKTIIGAALSGLILLILSATILRIIGVDVLGIPGLE